MWSLQRRLPRSHRISISTSLISPHGVSPPLRYPWVPLRIKEEDDLREFKKKFPVSNPTEEQCTYRRINSRSPWISLQHRTTISRGLDEEGGDPRILPLAKLSFMCEAAKRHFQECSGLESMSLSYSSQKLL